VSGRVTLVTGGSRGIGLAVARRLQATGDRVAVTYRSTAPAELGTDDGSSSPLYPVRCDVTSLAQVEAAFDEIESSLGAVEVLVCSAGITDDALLLRMGEERWSNVIETDLTACYRTTKRALGPMLKARRGRIVLVSSVVAYLGNPGQTNYAAAKAGIASMTWTMARELERFHVTVNAIAPRARTRLTEGLFGDMDTGADAFDAWDPANIAQVVGWLASEQAAGVSGQVFVVFGGSIWAMGGFHPIGELHRTGPWSPAELIAAQDDLFADASPGVPPFDIPQPPA